MKKTLEHIQTRKDTMRKHVDKKIIFQIRIFILIITIIIGIIVYNIFVGKITILLSLLGLLFGIFLGFVVGRIGKLSWSDEMGKVISQLDRLGVIFLILYISIEVGKSWFFGHWLAGNQLSAFTLAFLGGLLFGRLLHVVKGVKNILIDQDKI